LAGDSNTGTHKYARGVVTDALSYQALNLWQHHKFYTAPKRCTCQGQPLNNVVNLRKVAAIYPHLINDLNIDIFYKKYLTLRSKNVAPQLIIKTLIAR